jgi:glycosyltransferase involved in cell wall biosynthesis/capsular polysaccharide biosynthesis protein
VSQADLSLLHVIVRASETNSQYNEHCLPVMHERSITVCSLFPADVVAPPALRLVEGDGTTWGCFRALRQALALGTYDVVHVHAPASGVLTLVTYFLTRRSRRNLVFTLHNSWTSFRRRSRLFLYLILALFPTVVTCGRAVRESVPRSLRTVVGRRISVVQNGVDLARVDRCLEGADDDVRDPRPGLDIVSVGRLIPIKDPYTVLDAFVHAGGVSDRLMLVGDGELRTEIVAALEKAGLSDRVRITGLVERDEVYRLLWGADFFVSGSRGEGLPVAVLEAMACECPVVLSDIPPHREIARLAGGIPLVRPGDVAGMGDAMRRMIAMSTPDRRRLGAGLRRCVEEHFSVRSMNDAYGAVYRAQVARNNPEPRQRVRRRRTGPPDSELTLTRRMVRHWPLVVGLTLLGGSAGLGYAELQSPEYQAKSSVVVGEVFSGSPNDDSIKASQALATSYADLARREPVLRPVAAQLQLGDWRLLQPDVHAQPGDKNPLLIQITATAGSSTRAEQLAEAVATRLVELTKGKSRNLGREFVQREMDRLRGDIAATEERIDARSGQLDAETDPDVAAALQADLQDLRDNLVVLETSYQSMLDRFVAGRFAGEVQMVEHAYATPSPVRPDPISLTAAGLAAGLMLAAGLLHVATGGRRTNTPDEQPPLRIQLGELPPMPSNGWGDDQPRTAVTPRGEGGRR